MFTWKLCCFPARGFRLRMIAALWQWKVVVDCTLLYPAFTRVIILCPLSRWLAAWSQQQKTKNRCPCLLQFILSFSLLGFQLFHETLLHAISTLQHLVLACRLAQLAKWSPKKLSFGWNRKYMNEWISMGWFKGNLPETLGLLTKISGFPANVPFNQF